MPAYTEPDFGNVAYALTVGSITVSNFDRVNVILVEHVIESLQPDAKIRGVHILNATAHHSALFDVGALERASTAEGGVCCTCLAGPSDTTGRVEQRAIECPS